MMNLSGIQSVMQRMQEIEQRFGIKSTGSTAVSGNQGFPAQLQSQMKAQNEAENITTATGKRKVNAQVLPAGSKDIESMILQSAKKYGVDPRLVSAVAETESNYRPDAVSSAGAVGVMQLMPETASSLGVQNIYDPSQNIDGGVKYLKEMLSDFNGDVRKAVAAYNAGPQAVKEYNGVPPYAETQNYVNKVLDLYQ